MKRGEDDLRVGILKPDHLGDLVLSAPAIAALRRRFRNLVLYCHPHNVGLAQHLFPGLALRTLLMPHLDKAWTVKLKGWRPPADFAHDLDLLVCLRWDGLVQQIIDGLSCAYRAPEPSFEQHHVAVEHAAVVVPLTGHYDLSESYRYVQEEPRRRPTDFGKVGLSIAAGYRLNAWPLQHWIDLARRLLAVGAEVILVGGPAEATRLAVVADAIARVSGRRPDIVMGDPDFGGFLHRIAERCDWLIATDSGTAHLAALVRPVVSLFGGTPWFRFAPLGSHNVVLSQRLKCSPCRAFDREWLNTCHAQECLATLGPERVWSCLDAYLRGIDLTEDVRIDGVWLTEAPWYLPRRLTAEALRRGETLATNLL